MKTYRKNIPLFISFFFSLLKEFEKWTSSILPSRQFGFLVLTSTYGIMDHEEAKLKHTGGKILGFFY